jgi:hypothetical protein
VKPAANSFKVLFEEAGPCFFIKNQSYKKIHTGSMKAFSLQPAAKHPLITDAVKKRKRLDKIK